MQGVTKTFGPKTAVRDLNLSIPERSLYAFIGPNGAGKTTTIRMIMSILFPDFGEIRVLGKSSAVESKDRIGYLPEERGLYRKMKVGAFLTYLARLKGLDAGVAARRAKEWLDRMELKDCFKKKCEELSKGMQQKIQFIAAVMHEPDLIILDEVFSGLDPVNRRLIRRLMDEQHHAGRTIIFSTHAMYEAEQLCDRVFMIHQGNKVLDDPLQEVWRTHDPRSIIVEPLEPVGEGEIASWPGVESVRHASGFLEIAISDGCDPLATLRVVAQRVPVRRIELRKPTLEDVFVKLVGGDAAALRSEQEEFAGAASKGGES
jgi:ABC-2 type transport system ATP-binding protein